MQFIVWMFAERKRYAPSRLPQQINQTLRIMKLTAFFFTLFCMQVAANGVSQTVSLSGNNLRLEKVFTEIERQTGFLVVCNYDILQNAHAVNLSVNKMPLEEVLQKVLFKQSLDFKINKSNIVISRKKPQAELALSEEFIWWPIKGVVVDNAGIPLAGATVRVKGKNTTLMTDDLGGFSLNADAGMVLTISFIGYEPQELKLTSGNELKVVLVKKEDKLEDVAVISTGYQSLPKERSAGSFSNADVNIMRDRNFTTNILEQLDGLVPGLTINNSPGADKVQIRGLNTINGNRSPLVVVDGLPLSDISAINPNDIADVTVLKDATAASIWGARAANGVIVITTKKGTAGDRMKVDYSGFVTFQGRPDYDYHNYMNSQQFVKTAEEIFDPVVNPWSNMSTSYFIMPHESILYNKEQGLISGTQARSSLDSLGAINNRDQANEFWVRNALLTNHSLSISGGGKIHRYYGSINYTNTVSNAMGEKNEQFKANLRQDFTIGKRIQLHIITDLSNTDRGAKRPLAIGADYLPYQLFQDNAGNAIDFTYLKFPTQAIRERREAETKINLGYVPLDEFNLGATKSKNILARTLAGINVELFKGLQFEGLYGYTYGHGRQTDEELESSYTTRYKVATLTAPPATVGGNVVRYIPETGGIYSVRNTHARQWTVRNQLAYKLNYRKHQINAIAGQEAQQQGAFSESSKVFGYNPQLMTYANVDYTRLMQGNGISGGYFGWMALSSSDAYYNMTDELTRLTSYYANAAYAYNHKYVFNASWRIDESNLYGKDKAAQNRPVWSLGAKWLMGDEAFMQNNGIVNKLDIRGTYGISGNSPNPGVSASQDIISSYSDGVVAGGSIFYVEIPGNPGLSWERTATVNMGLDFTIAGNRLYGSFDFYSKKTEGLIGAYPLNPFTGHSSTTGNLGNIDNKGIELALTSRNIKTRNFSWTTNLILSYNKNKLKSLEGSSTNITGTSFTVGRPAYALYGYDFVGLNSLGDPKIQLANKTITSSRVTTRLEDWLFMGTTQPVWNGSLRNSFTYKGFGLSINMIYNIGHVMRHDNKVPFTNGRLTNNISTAFDNRWKSVGDSAITNIPSYVANTTINSSRRNIDYFTNGSVNVLSASYVKIRDLGFTYQIPALLSQKIRSNDMSVRLQVNNILLWRDNNVGIDPEFRGTTPFNQRSVTIGLRANF